MIFRRLLSRLRSNSTESCSPSSTPNSSALSSSHLGDQHLDHHLGRLLVELLDDLLDLLEEPRRGADDQRVADRLGHHDHFAFDLLEGADQSRRGLLHDAFAAEELVDRGGHVVAGEFFSR